MASSSTWAGITKKQTLGRTSELSDKELQEFFEFKRAQNNSLAKIFSKRGEVCEEQKSDKTLDVTRGKQGNPSCKVDEVDGLDGSYVDYGKIDDVLEQHDAQRLTPPMDITPKRCGGEMDKKRLFHDDEQRRFTQEIFESSQIKELEKRFSAPVFEKKRTFSSDDVGTGSKYKKVEAEEGRILHAYYTPNHESRLPNFQPFFINIGNPAIAKEMVCIR